ncbi:MAG TPA: hypothetical protein VNC78_10555 [Actinomycetota bacterium]|nr:hypothetical protein [Actinomycetota bacterium]
MSTRAKVVADVAVEADPADETTVVVAVAVDVEVVVAVTVAVPVVEVVVAVAVLVAVVVTVDVVVAPGVGVSEGPIEAVVVTVTVVVGAADVVAEEGHGVAVGVWVPEGVIVKKLPAGHGSGWRGPEAAPEATAPSPDNDSPSTMASVNARPLVDGCVQAFIEPSPVPAQCDREVTLL